MKMEVSLFLLALFFAGSLPAHAGTGSSDCSTGKSQRNLAGPEPATKDLRAAAEAGGAIFFEKGKFDTEDFTYLGEVVSPSGKRWFIVYLDTTWGLACRATKRLLVFNADRKYLGQYYAVPEPTKISGDTVFFDTEDGNTIKFTDSGPPKTAQIDGDDAAFEP
ncbi:MAG TPA: hypothetical protein VGT99_13530 [Gammaproteobacteria bacterium]|nr:hypothetical protein [Gammaproteobacteria bacterium]